MRPCFATHLSYRALIAVSWATSSPLDTAEASRRPPAATAACTKFVAQHMITKRDKAFISGGLV
jgi:hypothetical protein